MADQCERCGVALAGRTRRARFCSARCRVAAHRARYRPTLDALRNGTLAVTQRPMGVARAEWLGSLAQLSARTFRRYEFVKRVVTAAAPGSGFTNTERSRLAEIDAACRREVRPMPLSRAERECRMIQQQAVMRLLEGEAVEEGT